MRAQGKAKTSLEIRRPAARAGLNSILHSSSKSNLKYQLRAAREAA